MNSKNTTIKVENISKVYRIGVKEQMHDSLGGAIANFISSPLKNYHKYRSLYKFDDIIAGQNFGDSGDPSDIIWALNDVSFEAERGEVIGIVGSNGAGKSTLLKILSRITPPTRGYAEIRGKVSSLLEVGTGFHNELTGRENVYLNGTILGMKKREVERKFDEMVEFSGVERFLDTPVKRYSSGMKVRLAFAVAAHLDPEILVVDEVLAVGDADFQRKCLNKMQDVGQHGQTVLFVSHSMQAITRLCQRVILLEDGRLTQDGPSHEVVSAYLGSGFGTSAIRQWSDAATAPGRDVGRLHAVRIRGEDGQIAETVEITRPVAVEIEYEVLKSGYVLLPHFHLFNDEGVFLFVAVDLDPSWRRRPRPTGRYVSIGWIPGNLLAEGTMFVSPCLITLDPDTPQFHERDAVSFQVVDK